MYGEVAWRWTWICKHGGEGRSGGGDPPGSPPGGGAPAAGEPLGEHGVGTLPRGELEDAIILGNIIIVIAPNEL